MEPGLPVQHRTAHAATGIPGSGERMATEFIHGHGPWESPESGTFIGRQQYAWHASQAVIARMYARRMLGPRCGFDSELIAAELVSNAIRHTASGARGGHFIVYVMLGRTAGIAVQDLGGSGSPCVGAREEGGFREGGRGLEMVTKLALRAGYWGDEREGHTVWAELRTLPSFVPKAC